LHYKFADFNSKFTTQTDANTTILTSNVTLQFRGEPTINNDQQTKYVLTYNNTTPKPMSNLKLVLSVPSTFKVSEYNPQPDIGTTYNLANLDPNSPRNIEITGKFQGASDNDSQTFSAKVQGLDDNGRQILLSSSDYIVRIVPIPLTATLSTNTSEGSVDPGGSLSYRITYKNNSSVPLKGVKVTARLRGDAIDLASVQATNGSVDDYVITWDASQVPALATLQPNDSGDLDINFRIKNPATKANIKNMVVSIRTDIQSSESEQVYTSSERETKVNTVANISTNVIYSSGSRPPRVGQPTKYTVVLGIQNATNELNNGLMTMTLPNALSFDKSTINPEEQPNITYDANTKKLTWKIGTVQAHAGYFNALRKLQFSVVVTPSSSLEGQAVPLVTNMSFSAKDAFTEKAISLSPSLLTTADEPSGEGQVQQ
jgi:hypothetical protein